MSLPSHINEMFFLILHRLNRILAIRIVSYVLDTFTADMILLITIMSVF